MQSFTALYYTRTWGASAKQLFTREEFLAECASKTDLHYAHLIDNNTGFIELTISNVPTTGPIEPDSSFGGIE
jgi:hypothetical protein